MISKQLFIDKLQKEVHIIKHLAAKATTSELLNFQFSDTQRTTAQWLAYLALIGSANAQEVLLDDGSGFTTFAARYEAFDTTMFTQTINEDLQKVIELLQNTSEEKLAENKTLRGATDTRAGHMLSLYNIYVGYKTQMFLQLKAAGLTDLSTMNLWAGMDVPSKL